jgi:hypothetical protein
VVAAVLNWECEMPAAAVGKAGSQSCNTFGNLRGQTGIAFNMAGRPGQNGGHPFQKKGGQTGRPFKKNGPENPWYSALES